MTIPPEQWRDGLLVRSPNWLGDLVMTFPALMLLKRLLLDLAVEERLPPLGCLLVAVQPRLEVVFRIEIGLVQSVNQFCGVFQREECLSCTISS